MSLYDLYAIGNALVDLEYQVSDGFLQTNNIDKGVMTLVDADRQKFLLKNIQGELVKSQSGGSAANTVIAAAQLGAKTFYCAKVAQDEMGQLYCRDLEDCGVAHSLNNGVNGQTGTCLVMVTNDGERTMNTNLGVSGSFSESDLDLEALAQSDLLYIEGYLVCNPESFKAALKAKQVARQKGVKIALTFSDPSVVKAFRQQFNELLRDGIHYLFANEEEVQAFCQLPLSEKTMRQLGVLSENVIATQGEKGILGLQNSQLYEVPPTEVVRPLDTNGAGDMVAGCFLYGIQNGLSFSQSCQLANRGAAKVISQFGPRLPKEQLKSLL